MENGTSKEAVIVQTFTKEDTVVLDEQGAAWVGVDQEVEDDEDAPYHILTSLRLLRQQPKKVQDAVTFYLRTGAWFSHSECLLLSLLASSNTVDRCFAVDQIVNLGTTLSDQEELLN